MPDKRLDKQQQPQQRAIIARESIEAAVHSGPLPSPDLLRKYDEVHPGLAERLVRLAEGEAAHRREIEATSIRADAAYMQGCLDAEKRGQFLATTVAIVLPIIGGILVWLGHDTAGATIGTAGVVSIVTALIIGRSKKEENAAAAAEQAKQIPQTPQGDAAKR